MTEDNKKNRVVLVTGFGPFRGHYINASWEAVKKLKDLGLQRSHNITLITQEIPVVYETVSTVIPELWSEYNPMLVVHVGVSSVARCLTLEFRAFQKGYIKSDVLENYPNESNCVDDSKNDFIETCVDVERICSLINNSNILPDDEACKAVVSYDAGRYLCEYMFYQSLSIDPGKTIFVHVPDFDVYPLDKTICGLYELINFTIETLDRNKN